MRDNYTFRHALGAVYCSSPEITTDGRVKWTLTGEVNKGSGKFYYELWQRARQNLRRDVKLWQKRGFDIEYSDFVIQVEQPREDWRRFGSDR